MNPLISVVIPAYNCASYINRALGSVWAQADPNLEVIVVDDGSTDDTAAALEPFSSRIRMVRQSNQGVAAARNAGIAMARGTWLAFLDADDAWHPERLRVGRQALTQQPDAALLFSNFSLVDQNNWCLVPDAVKSYYGVFNRYGLQWKDILQPLPARPLDQVGPARYAGNCFASLYLGNFIKTSTVLVRRSVVQELGGFDPRLVTEEDYDLWLRLALDHSVVYVDAPLVDVRRRPDQLTSAENALTVASNSVRVVARTTERASGRLQPAVRSRRLADVHRRLAHVALVAGDRRTARQAVLASLRFGGLQPLSVAMLVCSVVPDRVTLELGRAWRAARKYLS